MSTSLTERYISATVKSLPPAAQSDVRAELQASIDDAVEARIEQGQERGEAETAVLNELGDPAVLAAGYADRPLHLIGPRYFLTWWRLLKLLLIIVPICAVFGVVLAQAIAEAPVGQIIGQAVVVGLAVVMHVCFWVTLVFAILERTTGTAALPEWTVDSLPESADKGVGRGDLIASLVFLGLAAAALLWDRYIGFVLISDDRVAVGVGVGSETMAMPILNPALWPWWMGGLFVVIGLEAALAIAVYATRGWRPIFAVINTVLAVVTAGAAVYLLVTGQLVNPAFLEFALGRADVPAEVGRILATLLGVVVVGIAVWDVIDGWLKTVRRRAA